MQLGSRPGEALDKVLEYPQTSDTLSFIHRALYFSLSLLFYVNFPNSSFQRMRSSYQTVLTHHHHCSSEQLFSR